jgi:nicotinamidase-related amidase
MSATYGTRKDATFLRPDTEGVEIHPELAPAEGELVITKEYANSFRETALEDELRARGADSLVVCGMMTSMCVDATVRAAVDLGFDTTVVHDACATCDLQFDGRSVPALEVHSAFLAALGDGYAAVVSSDEIAG